MSLLDDHHHPNGLWCIRGWTQLSSKLFSGVLQTVSEAVTKVVATAIADALAIIEDGEAIASSGVDTSTKVDEKSEVKSTTVDTPKGNE